MASMNERLRAYRSILVNLKDVEETSAAKYSSTVSAYARALISDFDGIFPEAISPILKYF